MDDNDSDVISCNGSDEYSDNEELAGLNFDIDKENSSKQFEDPFVVLDADKTLGELEIMKNDVFSLTGLPLGVCAIAFSKFQWNKEKLFETFFNSPNYKKFLFDNKILQVDSMYEDKGTCNICYDEDADLITFSCTHSFCRDCWEGNLQSKVNDKEWKIKCMDPECAYFISEEIVRLLTSSDPLFKQYQILSAESFIQVSDLVKFCPGADCGRIIRANFPECHGVRCNCNESFCMKCEIGNHDPITCQRLERWTKKSGEDNETLKWLQKHSKPCPQCKRPIEKNGGCNHMTCRSGCGYEFCWLCMGHWTPHHGCNQVAPAQNFMDADLEAFVHYNRRFMNHKNSLKLEKKLKEEVNKKIRELHEVYEFTDGEIRFLEKAVVTLSECRRAVMYSYSFAFFINQNNQKIIFEDNQKRLEQQVEKLSGLLENEFEEKSGKIKQWKQEVIDVSKYVDKQRSNLLAHVLENDRKNQWDYKQGA